MSLGGQQPMGFLPKRSPWVRRRKRGGLRQTSSGSWEESWLRLSMIGMSIFMISAKNFFIIVF